MVCKAGHFIFGRRLTMKRPLVSRIALTFTILGFAFFSLIPDLPINAQDKDTCRDPGWTPIDASEIDLNGTWAGHQNRNCKESAQWQYNFSVRIDQDRNGDYIAGVINIDKRPMEVDISGSGIVFVRDLT